MRFGAVPYALLAHRAARAATAESLDCDGCIDASMLAPGAASDALGAGSVGSDEIADGSIGADDLAAGAVDTQHISAGAVTAGQIDTGAVGSDEIAAGAVGRDAIAAGAVGADQLDSGAVTRLKIAEGAITGDRLAEGTLTSREIGTDAVTPDELAAGAVTSDKLAASLYGDSGTSAQLARADHTHAAGNYAALLGSAAATPQTGHLSVTGEVLAGTALGAPLLRLTPLSAAPQSPAAGAIYFDQTSKQLRIWDGTGWIDLARRADRTVAGFSGTMGPDLSGEGFTQCYGWTNTGSAAPPSYSYTRTNCGGFSSVIFAGYRCGSSTLVRHDLRLGVAFSSFLPSSPPSSTTFYKDVDISRQYSWYVDGAWFLLVKYNNG
jgi:hypothetical protein